MGRIEVDNMDEVIFTGLFEELQKCIATAGGSDRSITPKAQIYMVLWINMTGAPTVLLRWLSGETVRMAKTVPSPGKIVDAAAMEGYLRATDFFSENPGNMPHFLQSAAGGANVLGEKQLASSGSGAQKPPGISEPSGAQWCSRFPGSRSVEDLVEPFKTSVNEFFAALSSSAAVQVDVNATFRPPERAYLMHYAWCIARGLIQATQVPPMTGVDIVWDHPNAIAAAEAMVQGYGMVFIAALASNHTKGLAIDMNITWSGALTVTDANGATRNIAGGPRNNDNLELQSFAGTFGVHKLASDPPHWSINGH
jgi:hypothetical protein